MFISIAKMQHVYDFGGKAWVLIVRHDLIFKSHKTTAVLGKLG
jgi:hypothetical protein